MWITLPETEDGNEIVTGNATTDVQNQTRARFPEDGRSHSCHSLPESANGSSFVIFLTPPCASLDVLGPYLGDGS